MKGLKRSLDRAAKNAVVKQTFIIPAGTVITMASGVSSNAYGYETITLPSANVVILGGRMIGNGTIDSTNGNTDSTMHAHLGSSPNDAAAASNISDIIAGAETDAVSYVLTFDELGAPDANVGAVATGEIYFNVVVLNADYGDSVSDGTFTLNDDVVIELALIDLGD